MLSADKLPPHLRHMLRNLNMYGIHPEKLSREMRHMLGIHAHDAEGEWILVNGRFAGIHMSALAALLSKEEQVSPLTNE